MTSRVATLGTQGRKEASTALAEIQEKVNQATYRHSTFQCTAVWPRVHQHKCIPTLVALCQAVAGTGGSNTKRKQITGESQKGSKLWMVRLQRSRVSPMAAMILVRQDGDYHRHRAVLFLLSTPSESSPRLLVLR